MMSGFRRFGVIAGVALSLAVTTVAAPAAGAAAPGVLTITNSDPAPDNSRVVLSRIQTPADSYQRSHDQTTVRLTNSGGSSVTVSSIGATGPFTATSPWLLPFKLSAGASVDVPVKFTATYGAWYSGNLTVNSTSSAGAVSTVSLVGYWQKYSEKGLEPWLPDLVRNFGYTTVMPTAIYSRGAYAKFSSDEVLSPYWTLLDPAKPAGVTQLAAWHGYPSAGTFRSYPKGSPATYSTVLTSLKFDAQSALPRNSGWGKGTATFAPAGTFGLILDQEYSDPTLNNSAVDRQHGCTATQCGQHVRVWQVRGADGAVVPGSYLFVDDIEGINYDYQDNVFLVSNIQPAA